MAPKRTNKVRKTTGGRVPPQPAASRGDRASEVHQLKVTLLDTDPPIWRQFAVPSNITLEKLHRVIQIVMGWEECHLHQFITDEEQSYGPHFEEADRDWTSQVRDERKVRLSEIVGPTKARFVYEYDLGDGWQHELEIEHVGPAQPGVCYPTCLAGERACPPEDCGGTMGYYDFIDAISDTEHPGHEDMLDWIGGEFDAEAFDIEEVNKMLKEIN